MTTTQSSGSESHEKWVLKRRSDVAAALGVSTVTVNTWAQSGMPGDRGSYCLPDIVRWLRSKGPWRPHQKIVVDDELLLGSDSPALEKYRLVRTSIAEIDLSTKRGEFIARADVRTSLSKLAVLLRRCGERLKQKHGNAALEILNATLTEFEAAFRREFGEEDGPPETNGFHKPE